MTKSHLHDTVYLHHILPYGASLKNLFSGIKTSHYFPETIHICPLSFKPDIFLAGIILVVSLSMCAVWPGYSPSEKLFRSKTPAQRLIFWWGLKTPFFFFFVEKTSVSVHLHWQDAMRLYKVWTEGFLAVLQHPRTWKQENPKQPFNTNLRQ